MRSSSSSYGSRPRIYIGNLSNRVSDKEVENHFSKYGRVLRIDLKNGYGFAEYDDDREASSAVRNLDGLELDGQRIRVEHAKGPRKEVRESRSSKIARAPENRITVDNLHHSVTWQILKDHMRKAGDVMYANVERDSRGRIMGVVEFRSYDEMKRAIKKLDDSELNGSRIYLKEDVGRRSRSRSRSNDRYKPYGGRPRDERRRSRSPRDRSPRRDRDRSPRGRDRSPRRRSRSPPQRRRSPSPKENRKRDLSRSPPPKDKSPSPNNRTRDNSSPPQSPHQE